MIKNAIYVVTDIEADGIDIARNSMLSFASVAISVDGREVSSFEAVLSPLDSASPDPRTTAWFRAQPGAYTAAMLNPKPPADVMADFVAWIRALQGEAIFVAHPLMFDGPWIDRYLRLFTDDRLYEGPWKSDRLFMHPGLCLASFAAGRLGWPVWDCQITKYPLEWLGHHQHTHRAIDDARGYGRLLAHLLARNPTFHGRSK